MKAPPLLAIIGAVILLGAVTMGLLNLQTLSDLGVQQQALAAVHAGNIEAAGPQAEHIPTETPSEVVEPLSADEQKELLQLRRQHTELNRRMRELGAVETRHAELSRRLATSRDDPDSPSVVLPEGYMLRREAVNRGLASPEASLETFLWALENRDESTLFRTLTPESANEWGERMTRQGKEEMWNEAAAVPGFKIHDTESQPDGSLKVQLLIIPGEEPTRNPPSLTMRNINGEWRIEPE